MGLPNKAFQARERRELKRLSTCRKRNQRDTVSKSDRKRLSSNRIRHSNVVEMWFLDFLFNLFLDLKSPGTEHDTG